MSRTKDKSELEHLRGENKRLRAENRNLKKRVNHASKGKRKVEELEKELLEYYIEEEFANNNCPNCEKGTIKETDLGVRKIQTCDSCKWRKVTKIK